ncbi:MAG: DNA topoisomerase I [Candidatus Jordarchaeales archaeon]|nr:DNA topoisomerase I [Candidatus Jordarchaeia archaeon]
MSYTLIIAEKPSAAERIAKALDENGKPEVYEENGVRYYKATRDKTKLVIVPAIGHLFSVSQKGGGWTYPVFNVEWVATYRVNKRASNTKHFIDLISKLAKDADSFISATDFDIEGSQIAYNILKYACGTESLSKAKRMKFSALTKDELVNAYYSLSQTLDWGLIEAGRARHEIDWIYGINLSRALMTSLKNVAGKYHTLSTGRVQGPTLSFIARREREIKSFVPKPYWTISAQAEINGGLYVLQYEKGKILTKSEAEKVVEECSGQVGIITDVSSSERTLSPPPPFDISSLQSEAYSLFGYTPSRTMAIAERLYLAALISYPRTGSQKFPPSIDLLSILRQLREHERYTRIVECILSRGKLSPTEGKKEDPAHPPIHPTGTLPEEKLSPEEEKLFDLIVRRFLAVFGPPSIRESIKVTIAVSSHIFHLRGMKTKVAGWQEAYEPYVRTEEIEIPPVREGEQVKIVNVNLEEKYTAPPPRYNPNSLLKLMEANQIGTKATRADIIETLYERRYITGRQIEITDLGLSVINVLSAYCPRVLSVDLTRELEEAMNQIESQKKTRQEVIVDAIEKLTPILEDFKRKEKEIGEALREALFKIQQKQFSLGKCPLCGGELKIIRSRKSRKRFVGCLNYWSGTCNFSAPLPQAGILEPTGKTCPNCGFPTLLVRRPRRRPQELCVNWQKCQGAK